MGQSVRPGTGIRLETNGDADARSAVWCSSGVAVGTAGRGALAVDSTSTPADRLDAADALGAHLGRTGRESRPRGPGRSLHEEEAAEQHLDVRVNATMAHRSNKTAGLLTRFRPTRPQPTSAGLPPCAQPVVRWPRRLDQAGRHKARGVLMQASGQVYRRCGCIDPDKGRMYRAGRCPRLARRGHGSWYFSIDLPPTSAGGRRRVRRGGYASRRAASEALGRLRDLRRLPPHRATRAAPGRGGRAALV